MKFLFHFAPLRLRGFNYHVLAFLLFAFSIFPKIGSAQETCNPDEETCVGGLSPFTGCDGMQPNYLYIFNQLVGCNGLTATITPASAGTVINVDCTPSQSGCTPKVCVFWREPGCHTITVTYTCPGFTTTRSKVVYVSMYNQSYADFTVSNVSTCLPQYSFTITRTSAAPVKQHRIQVHAVDINGNPISPSIWNTGWLNGTIVSRTLTQADGIPFASGGHYKILLQTRDACAGDDNAWSPVYTMLNQIAPAVDFTVNGNSNFPVNLFNCNNSPMVMNDATDYPGCIPNLTTAEITMARATNTCDATLAGTNVTVTTPFAANYNLRSFFPGYSGTAGAYFISYRVRDSFGNWYGVASHCVFIGSLDPSDAEFLLNGPNNTPDLPRTNDPNAPNTAIGQFSCGLVLTNTTSQISSLDYFRVEIWRTIGSVNFETILNSGNIAINAAAPFPPGYDFNPATNLYFFNLSQTNVTNYRFRVRFTVHNVCGESFRESYFKIVPGHPSWKPGDDFNQVLEASKHSGERNVDGDLVHLPAQTHFIGVPQSNGRRVEPPIGRC